MIDDLSAYCSAIAEVHIGTKELIIKIVSSTATWDSVNKCLPNAEQREEGRALLAKLGTINPSPRVTVLLRRAFQSLSPGRKPLCGCYNSEHEYVAARIWSLLLEATGQRLSSEPHNDVVVLELFAEQISLLQQEECAAKELSESAMADAKGAMAVDGISESPAARLPDGPCGLHQWRQDGHILPGEMQDGAWRLVEFLWGRSNRTASYDDLAGPVYGEKNKPELVTTDSLGAYRRAANNFFENRNIPLCVMIASITRKVSIREKN